MVQVKFSGELKSKGHPSSKWKFPKWLYRMFVWESKIPVSKSWTFEEGQISADWDSKNVFLSLRETEDEVILSVGIIGYVFKSFTFEKDLLGVRENIKVKGGGQELTGLFEVYWD